MYSEHWLHYTKYIQVIWCISVSVFTGYPKWESWFLYVALLESMRKQTVYVTTISYIQGSTAVCCWINILIIFFIEMYINTEINVSKRNILLVNLFLHNSIDSQYLEKKKYLLYLVCAVFLIITFLVQESPMRSSVVARLKMCCPLWCTAWTTQTS